MLEEAAKTGLYKDLKLVKLGTEPLPAQAGTFISIMALPGNSTPLHIFLFDLFPLQSYVYVVSHSLFLTGFHSSFPIQTLRYV